MKYNGRTCLVVITPVTLLMLNFCRSPGVTMKAYVMTSSRSASNASTRKTSVSASASSFTLGAYREQSLNTGLRLLLMATLVCACCGCNWMKQKYTLKARRGNLKADLIYWLSRMNYSDLIEGVVVVDGWVGPTASSTQVPRVPFCVPTPKPTCNMEKCQFC